MYSAANVTYRAKVRSEKLKPGNVQIKTPEPTIRKKYRDWQGKYYNSPPVAGPNAYNRPLKKILYDTMSDTRSIWPRA